MDKTALVERNIEDGRRLLEALDEADFQVLAALWLYVVEDEEWRFMVASPLVGQRGTKESYAFIQGVLAQLSPPSEISLKQVSVVSPKHDLLKLFRIAIRTGPGLSEIRFTGNTINNVFIKDAYIYRMQ